MPRYYDKDALKAALTPDNIFDLLALWGADPSFGEGVIISETICHNFPGEGSRKLYYYFGTRLFNCYTSCGSFDIFELYIKVQKKQEKRDCTLYDAMDFIAGYFGLDSKEELPQANKLKDWEIFEIHNRIKIRQLQTSKLPEYDKRILEGFPQPRILDWEREGISHSSCLRNQISYYPGREQIIIPHFDIDNRLVGVRTRALIETDALKYGKYRPLFFREQTYSHPLSMNLYNLNNSKDNIRTAKTAIIFESEKATLQFQSYYGAENDISVACCGSNISSYHIQLLLTLGVRELVVAFDRQFQEIGDTEFQLLKAKLIKIYEKYNKVIRISAIFDKRRITPYKASPIDISKETFEQLLKERIVPRKEN